jgi:queuine tRNA-ribosyltransferase
MRCSFCDCAPLFFLPLNGGGLRRGWRTPPILTFPHEGGRDNAWKKIANVKTTTKKFELIHQDSQTQARAGVLRTAHGSIETPVFMPVGTQATVKTLTPKELEDLKAQVLLSNTYHLYIRPGIHTIQGLGGLHRFMGWSRPILTDSGGYQVFSLARLRNISDEGVRFNSHFDGREIFLTPEEVVKAQEGLGSDIAMVFDECPPHDASKSQVDEAVRRTIRWAKRAKAAHTKDDQLLFGIIQGGRFLDLRKQSLEETVSLDFPGYAIGGVSVGEPRVEMEEVTRETAPKMPAGQPRYLMGVGTPVDFFWAIEAGIDMFDCVNPTRYGRNGCGFTRFGKVVVRNAEYAQDKRPLDASCSCYTCTQFSRSYLRHLFNCEEILGHKLVTLHNVHFFVDLVRQIRISIIENKLTQFKKNFLSSYDETSR